jgi:hypothetical protein
MGLAICSPRCIFTILCTFHITRSLCVSSRWLANIAKMRILPSTHQDPRQQKYDISLMPGRVHFIGFEKIPLQLCPLYRILISLHKPNPNPKLWCITWIDSMYKSYFLGAHVPNQGLGWLQAYTLMTEWLARSMSDYQFKSTLVHVRSHRSRDVFMRAAIKQKHIHCLILHPSRDKRTLLAESRTVSIRIVESASSDGAVISLQKSIYQ